MSNWAPTPLNEVLELQRRWIKVEPLQTYREIGIRSFGKGIFHKPPIEGSTLGNKRVLRIEPGDLVFNNVFAWEGAVAVAGSGEAGMIGSHRFITYTVNPELATPEFLRLFFNTEKGLAVLRKASPGSAGRNKTLGLERFISQDIPVPPLPEQRKIVEWINAVASRVDEAKELRTESNAAQDALRSAITSKIMSSLGFTGTLKDALRSKPRNGWSARCDGLESGQAILSLGAVTGFDYRSDKFKRTSEPTVTDAHYWLSRGDLLITRSNTPELVGHAAIYNGEPHPCIYPDLMMRLDVDAERYSTHFVHYVLRSRKVREFIRDNAKGTSPTMKKISQGIVMEIPFPSDCQLSEQRSIVKTLDRLFAKAGTVTETQSSVSTEIDNLLPAALNQAFNGEAT